MNWERGLVYGASAATARLLRSLHAHFDCSTNGAMQCDEGNVSAQYLELVREHLHRFRDALAVYFPGWAPDLALIELPGDVGCVPVPRRRVTDLLEFQGSEAQLDDGDGGDEDPPDGDDRDEGLLDDPPMTRVVNPEWKRCSPRKVS